MSTTNPIVLARPLSTAPAKRLLRASKLLMAALCFIVAAYAGMLLVAFLLRPPLMQQRFTEHPVSTSLHLAVGALVILLAPLQLSMRLRRRYASLHRLAGRAYAIGVVCSGIAGLALAAVSQGGMPAHLGFALLSLVWIFTTAMGVQRIRAGDVSAHQRWMVRSFALTFAAVTLRIYIPLGVVVGLPVEPSYQVIAWLCWVPNLAVAEWLLRPARAAISVDAFPSPS
jgi:uncharacterized membrane protein